MAHRDHIAITSRDKSTTRCEVSGAECPLAPRIFVTQRESSDTYRRIGLNSEILPDLPHPLRLGIAGSRHRPAWARSSDALTPGGERDLEICSQSSTECNLSCWKPDIDRYLTFFTTIGRLKPIVTMTKLDS